MLRSQHDELRDLAGTSPPIVDAATGRATGLRLVRWLGAGGMSSVFLAERDPALGAGIVSPLAPRQVALKLNKLSTERQLRRMNLDPLAVMQKELIALGRVMDRRPPTEFVVGFYGAGTVEVESEDARQCIPWLALEYIDGGSEGSTLHERVRRAGGGLDPLRCLRLARGITSGARVLHDSAVIHRDLKPENVFVTGPVDDETPKIGDFGIARIEGMHHGTMAALTPAYGGPEQVLSAHHPTEPNPLIGAWTDVHAIAALVWFMIAGEEWCRSDTDRPWRDGERRSLRTANGMHEGFLAEGALIDALDEVLARGAAHRLPSAAWAAPGADTYRRYAEVHFRRSMFHGPERYASVEAFRSALLPRLDAASQHDVARAVREQRPASTVRPTLLAVDAGAYDDSLADVHELPPRTLAAAGPAADEPAERGGVVFLQDAKALVRFGKRLVYFVSDRAHAVSVPEEHAALVVATRWLGRGPGGGFALAGEEHVLLVRGGAFSRMALPAHADGRAAGRIAALLADGRVFGVVTGETEDGDGPELWLSRDGERWSDPTVLPLGGEVCALAAGSFGTLVVGARRKSRARALHLALDGRITVFTAGVHDMPPLGAAVCGTMRESWAAGDGVILGFGPAGAQLEHGGEQARAGDEGRVAMLALDIVGVPWLVTEHAVLRRHVTGGEPTWKTYYQRDPHRAPLIGIGFSPDGAHVMDARGDGVLVVPHAWHPTEPSGR